MRLASGRNVDQIAAERTSTVGTVRGQVKSLLMKMGLSKQIELPAIIAQLW